MVIAPLIYLLAWDREFPIRLILIGVGLAFIARFHPLDEFWGNQ